MLASEPVLLVGIDVSAPFEIRDAGNITTYRCATRWAMCLRTSGALSRTKG